MKVIICEKPSQAKAVTKGLNLTNYDYDKGYYTNGDIYATLCFGTCLKEIILKVSGKLQTYLLLKKQLSFYKIQLCSFLII